MDNKLKCDDITEQILIDLINLRRNVGRPHIQKVWFETSEGDLFLLEKNIDGMIRRYHMGSEARVDFYDWWIDVNCKTL